MTYRADIDGLRAFAVFAVVLGHLGLAGFNGGFVGVDIFFVISGFLITNYLVERASASHGKISLKEFYFRRARRILPMALVVLVATTVAALVLFNEVKATQVATDSYWAALFLANLHLIQLSTDYFNQAFAASPVQHYWSLAVEEQFYLVFPLVVIATIWISTRMRRAWLGPTLLVVALGTLASLTWSIALGSSASSEAYFSSGTRAYELGIGAILALALSMSKTRVSNLWSNILGIVGLSMMAISVVVLSGAFSFPSFWALIPTLGAALFILGGTPRDLGGAAQGAGTKSNFGELSDTASPVELGLVNRFFSLTPIVYLGKISFSLYLIHWPILIYWSQLDPEASKSWWWIPANVLVVTGLSVITHRFVEKPFRSLEPKPKNSDKTRRLAPAAALLAAMLLIGSSAYAITGGTLNTAFQRSADSGNTDGQFEPNPDPSDGEELPNPNPTDDPSASPSASPSTSGKPTNKPTDEPTGEPTDEPTEEPTEEPVAEPRLVDLLDAWRPKVEAATNLTKVPEGLDPPIAQLLNQRGVQWAQCMDPGYHQPTCTYGPSNAKRTAVILGDSYALAIYPMVIEALGLKDWRVVGLNRRECMVADITPWPWSGSTPDAKCVDHRQWVNSYIASTKPDLVILSDQPFHPIADGDKKAEKNHDELWETGLNTALGKLTELSNNIVYFGVPSSAKGLVDCVQAGGVLGKACTAQSSWFDRYISVQQNLATNHSIPFINPNNWLCYTGDCPAIIDNTPVFWDGSHFTQNMAAKLAPLFRAFLIENGLL